MKHHSIVDASQIAIVLDRAEPAARPRAAAAVDPFRWHWVDFCMQAQVEDQWCWAATAVSIDWYFNHGSQLRQCSFAGQVLGIADCCPTLTVPGNPTCDQPFSMTAALTALHRLRRKAGPATFAQVKHQIDAGRPLAIHAGFDADSGHIAAVTGYRQQFETLRFQD